MRKITLICWWLTCAVVYHNFIGGVGAWLHSPVTGTAPGRTIIRQRREGPRRCRVTARTTTIDPARRKEEGIHNLDGIVCREIQVDLPLVGTVTVLEATAESQEDLVDMALALDEDELFSDSNMKLSAGDPYGAVLWPAAWAVSNYLLTNHFPGVNGITMEQESGTLPLSGISIVELGTGTGLVSIAAALGGASVIATDYEPLALILAEYAATKFHGISTLELKVLDMCDFDTTLPDADIAVAADIMYEPKTGIAMAHRAVEALKRGSRVIVGDSPGRPGRPAFLKTLKDLGVTNAAFRDVVGWTSTGPRHELICGKESSSISPTPKELTVALMDLEPSILR